MVTSSLLAIFAGFPIQSEPSSRLACAGLQTPVCGVREGPRTLQLKWPKRALTWSFAGDVPPGWTAEYVRRTIAQAFTVWAAACDLTFSESTDTNADILIRFGEGQHADDSARPGEDPPFDGSGGVLAHAFYPGAGIGGDCHVDLAERWVVVANGPNDGLSLLSTLIHEFGHSLGFDHAEEPDSALFYAYNGRTSLSESDRRRAVGRYGRPSSPGGDSPTRVVYAGTGTIPRATKDVVFPADPGKVAIDVRSSAGVPMPWRIGHEKGRQTDWQTGPGKAVLDRSGRWKITVAGEGVFLVRVVKTEG